MGNDYLCFLYGTRGTKKNKIFANYKVDAKTKNEITIQNFEESLDNNKQMTLLNEDMGIIDRTMNVLFFKLREL